MQNLTKLKNAIFNIKNADLASVSNEADSSTEKNEARNQAIQMLINRGKSKADAELIVKAMEEWEMDYTLAATLDFKVIGDSVWIDNEE